MNVELLTNDLMIRHMIPNSVNLLEQCRQNKLDRHKMVNIATVRQHETIMETLNLSFLIKDISYAAHVHLIRHRLTTPFVQSNRIVNNELSFVVPESMIEALGPNVNNFLAGAIEIYIDAIECGVPAEDARYILPQGLKINLGIHMNLRQLRHIIKLRTDQSAHWEIREVVEAMKEECCKDEFLREYLT